MAKQIHFRTMPDDERQLITLNVVNAISSFLQLFVSPVIARRLISAILIIAGARSGEITRLTGLCERSVRSLKNQLVIGNTDGLFDVNSGRGRKSKFKDIEAQIIEEIEKGNYQTLQQIADMVYDKFNVKVSIMAVSRLLKKTKSAS